MQNGVGNDEFNAVFYLSSSPWNLYELFGRFIEVHDIPKGPIILKDLGIEKTHLFKSSHVDHKRTRIEELFDTYPELPFNLVGDSGQKDPEIYRDIARTHPHRVRAIYVRDVTDSSRDREVRRISGQVGDAGVEMLLVRDTLAAAEHAAGQGWIDASAVDAVRRAAADDGE